MIPDHERVHGDVVRRRVSRWRCFDTSLIALSRSLFHAVSTPTVGGWVDKLFRSAEFGSVAGCNDANRNRALAENGFTKRCVRLKRTAHAPQQLYCERARRWFAQPLRWQVVPYCLSYTETSSCAAPLASVNFVVNVKTLPCAEMVRVVDPTTFPFFFSTLLTVLPLTRFNDNES